MNPVNFSGIENNPVALQWQRSYGLAEWKSIGIIDPNFGLIGSGLVEWFPSGRVTLNWFISDCFPRSLASIEASARGKHLEMKLYYRDGLP